MEFNVKGDVTKILTMLDETQRSIIPKAAARAINKTMITLAAQVARDIKKDIGGQLAINEIKAGLSIVKANPKQLYAVLYAKGRRIPIIKLDASARQNQTGVSYKTSQGRQQIPHAFIATMKSGHKGVFKRKGRSRLSIQELHGPSLPKVFTNNAIQQAILRIAKERWAKVFTQEINFELSRLR